VNVNNTSVETITTPSILSTTGAGAIVDWVFLELRKKDGSGTVMGTRSALLRRDGFIVDVDGVSDVLFPNNDLDDYYLMIRHRNHLGIMTATAVSPNNDIDFTVASTPTFGASSTSARKLLEPNVYGLIAGNTNMKANDLNFQIKYNNSNNDRVEILNRVGTDTPLNVVPGYYLEDVNLNGVVKYSGSNNDRVIILNNVGPSTPLNVVTQQPQN